MKRLFLASQIDESLDKMLVEFGIHPPTTNLVFITTASNPDPKPLEERGSWKAITSAGFTAAALDIEGTDTEQLEYLLEETHVVVMGGGNPFYLLDQIRKTGADEVLTDFAERGVLAGSSAGSVVCCPDIEYIAPMDEPDQAPELKDTAGLGLIPWYIVPHVGDPRFDPAPDMIDQRNSDLDLIFLHNHQAVLVMDDDARVV